MKTASDPRHQNRRICVQQLFSWSINPDTRPDNREASEVISHLKQIDEQIVLNAPEWSIDKVNRIDLAVLRLGFYELNYQSQVSPKVVIDEAVELAKEFGSEKSSAFVNAVLAKYYEQIK